MTASDSGIIKYQTKRKASIRNRALREITNVFHAKNENFTANSVVDKITSFNAELQTKIDQDLNSTISTSEPINNASGIENFDNSPFNVNIVEKIILKNDSNLIVDQNKQNQNSTRFFRLSSTPIASNTFKRKKNQFYYRKLL